MSEPTAVLQLRDVIKDYAGPPVTRALHGITFDVMAGEWVAIVGPSGSGKSTLLNLVGALDRPTEGRALVAGVDLASLKDEQLSALRAREIGFVFQQFHLLEGLSALDNVALGLLYQGVDRAERRQRSDDALAKVRLDHRRDHRPAQMSGGEQQRVAIARAIVSEPTILLADEPTGNLDTATGAEVLDTFRALHAAGVTIVLITHDEGVAAAAPRVITVRDGLVEDDRATDRPPGRLAAAGGGR